MVRWSIRLALFCAVALAAAVPATTLGRSAASPGRGEGPSARSVAPATLHIYYTNPVLVRAGERVLMPVDAVCATRDGRPCQATVTVGVRTGTEGWGYVAARAVPGLRFDLTAPASRAVLGSESGAVDFFIRAKGPNGETASLGGARPGHALRFFVVRSLLTLEAPKVPFGSVRKGEVELFLPWGTGPMRAGLVLGNESATLGPSSFDVDSSGRIHLVDSLQHRVAVFESGRPIRESRVEMSARTAVAIDTGGVDHLADSTGSSVRVRSVDPAGNVGPELALGPKLASEIRAVGDHAFVRVLPLDAWVRVGGPAGAISAGLPGPDGGELIRIGRERSVRVATVSGDRVIRAVELTSGWRLGEVALAQPDGRGGFVVVVRVARALPAPADQYQVVQVSGGRIVGTFAVASDDFAQSPPASRFRLGPDARLYQLTSSPEGVRIVRFGIGEES
jgi:hypothetical protein